MLLLQMGNKRTGEVILANFDWADDFEQIKKKDETRLIACVQISHDEFRELRKKGC